VYYCFVTTRYMFDGTVKFPTSIVFILYVTNILLLFAHAKEAAMKGAQHILVL